MTRKQQRLILVVVVVALLSAATGLVLFAFKDSVAYFKSPSDIAAGTVSPGSRLRLGGLVESGSVKKDGSQVAFRVTDLNKSVTVRYTGILPDLFREGQGVVIEGTLATDGVFMASEVLAKHDEKYMPPDVAEELKKSGKWTEGDTDKMKAQQSKP
jgi:cytochrome c-type biogenesis protein CcmE